MCIYIFSLTSKNDSKNYLKIPICVCFFDGLSAFAKDIRNT